MENSNQRQPPRSAISPDEMARRKIALSELAPKIGNRYARATLHGFELYGTADEIARQRAAVAAVRDYCANIIDRVKSGRSVILFGPIGTGKDHFAAVLMCTAIRQGVAVEWQNGVDLFGKFRDGIAGKKSEAETIRRLATPAVLCISDPLPPVGSLTPFQSATFFRIVDRRYRDGKPTWLTANVASGQEAEQRLGAAAVDRIREGALAVFCNWSSYRTHRQTTDHQAEPTRPAG